MTVVTAARLVAPGMAKVFDTYFTVNAANAATAQPAGIVAIGVTACNDRRTGGDHCSPEIAQTQPALHFS